MNLRRAAQCLTLAGLILADFSTFYVMGLMAFGGA